MKLMYISGNTIAFDHKDLIKHFGSEEIEVQSANVDFYITSTNIKVLESKDPRIHKFFGTYKPNAIDAKKQKRSYTLCSFNESTELFTAKYFHLDSLRYEVQYDNNDNIISMINYMYPKKGNQQNLRIDVIREDDCITIKHIYPHHRNNEYYSTKLYVDEIYVLMENRYNSKNDWYELHKSTYPDVSDIKGRIPKFDFDKLKNGQLIL